MAVEFQDYYKTLGVERGATEDQIKRAYRKLARKYHPDISKAPDAEEKFKQLNEAHEVLKDPEKRKLYDRLGADWKAGQDFRPPPDWKDMHFESRSGPSMDGFDAGGFSDFFREIFGGGGRARAARGEPSQWVMRGADHEADIAVALEDAYHGAVKSITLQGRELGPDGQIRQTTNAFKVRIPAGVTDGKRIRLPKKGGAGLGGGPPGDLHLRVHIEPHRRFRLRGKNLEVDVPVTPEEAALGAAVEIPLIDGEVKLTIPEGVQSGQKLRLKGKGFPFKKGGRGDLLAVVKIVVPKKPSSEEKALFEEMAKVSDFNPRKKHGD